MRGRSYSPSPPRGGYGRRGRSPSPRGRYSSRGGGRDLPTSLLVRNLRHDCRPDDLRRPFGQFGPLKDVYLPKDYYSGEPRGFGFVQYVDPADAEEAKYHMDGSVLLGRQLTVVFAEENRKKPQDMRSRDRPSRGRHYDRRSPPRYSQSPPRYERSRSRYSRSPPRYARSPRSPPPKRRQYSRSVSPEERRYNKERSYSHSPGYNGRGPSPIPERSPPAYVNAGGSRSPSRSPVRGHPSSRSPSRSRSPVEYARRPERDISLVPELASEVVCFYYCVISHLFFRSCYDFEISDLFMVWL